MFFEVKITFVGNKSRTFRVDEKNAKYLTQIGLYERREGFIGFADADFKAYVFALPTVESIEIKEEA